MYKAIMSFPNGSGAGPDKLVPQIFKDLNSKSNGNASLNFLKSLTKLLNLIGEGEVPEQLRPFFFGAKLIALVKIGEVCDQSPSATRSDASRLNALEGRLSQSDNFFWEFSSTMWY